MNQDCNAIYHYSRPRCSIKAFTTFELPQINYQCYASGHKSDVPYAVDRTNCILDGQIIVPPGDENSYIARSPKDLLSSASMIRQRQIVRIISGAFLLLLIACGSSGWAQRMYSTVSSFRYNKRKDQSEYSVLPLGGVILPGKWKKGKYDGTRKQQWFSKRDDSLLLAVTFAPCDAFEFNHDRAKTGFEFVKSYYNWESEYFMKSGVKAAIIEQDSVKGYLIWRVYGQLPDGPVDNYFAYAESDCRVSSFILYDSPKLQESEKLTFLKGLLRD